MAITATHVHAAAAVFGLGLTGYLIYLQTKTAEAKSFQPVIPPSSAKFRGGDCVSYHGSQHVIILEYFNGSTWLYEIDDGSTVPESLLVAC